MKGLKLLSLVVPAYKQEKTIIEDVKNLDKVLSSFSYKHEIIVVVDGFLDKTFERAKTVRSKNIKIIGYKKNHGKGYAVKYGVLKANGDVVGFIDAGLDIDPSEISIALDLMQWNDADIIIGSKLHPDSKVNYPTIRKIMSWVYREFTHLLFGFNVKDTQVGLKLFKKRVAYDIFSKIIIKSFAFDVEVLAVAYKLGYKKIYEFPIKLNFKGNSSISSMVSLSFWKIIFLMLWDTMAVYYRLKILHYYDRMKNSL
jgi:glycosyltransferase involved in cell wall biosynthesis